MVTTTPMPMAKPRPSVYNSDIVLPPKTHHLCLTVICEITLCPVSAKYRVCGSRDRHNGIYSPHNVLSYGLGPVPPTKKGRSHRTPRYLSKFKKQPIRTPPANNCRSLLICLIPRPGRMVPSLPLDRPDSSERGITGG